MGRPHKTFCACKPMFGKNVPAIKMLSVQLKHQQIVCHDIYLSLEGGADTAANGDMACRAS